MTAATGALTVQERAAALSSAQRGAESLAERLEGWALGAGAGVAGAGLLTVAVATLPAAVVLAPAATALALGAAGIALLAAAQTQTQKAKMLEERQQHYLRGGDDQSFEKQEIDDGASLISRLMSRRVAEQASRAALTAEQEAAAKAKTPSQRQASRS
jgi:hypothetical protein